MASWGRSPTCHFRISNVAGRGQSGTCPTDCYSGRSMHNLLNDAAQRALRYLDELDSRSVAPPAEAVKGLRRFHEALPEMSTEPREVLALLDEIGSPATVSTTGRR